MNGSPTPIDSTGPDGPTDAPPKALREALVTAGYGSVARAGQTWALRSPDGAPCTVQWVRADEPRAALDHRIRILRTVDHPQVAHAETVIEAGGVLGVVLRGTRGPTLDEALARRDGLDPREATALTVALAHGLVALHRAGLVLGPLSESDIVIAGDGRAHLRPRITPAPAGATRSDDVRSLAHLTRRILAEPAPVVGADDVVASAAHLEHGLVRAALLTADGSAGAGEPVEAGTFAAVMADAAEAAPIAVPDLAELAARALADEAVRRSGRSGEDRGHAQRTRTGRAGRSRRDDAAETAVIGRVRRPPAVAADAAPSADARNPGPDRAALDDTVTRLRSSVSTERRTRRRRSMLRTSLATVLAAGCVAVLAGFVLHGPRQADRAQAEPGRAGSSTVSPRTASATSRSSTTPVASPTKPVVVVSSTSDPDPTLDGSRPAEAARTLTVRRENMFAGRIDADDVTVAGSPARKADAALAARLDARGSLLAAPRATVTRVRLVPGASAHRDGESDRAVVRVDVTYSVGAATLVTANGQRTTLAAVPSRTDRIDLTWTWDGWRVSEVQ